MTQEVELETVRRFVGRVVDRAGDQPTGNKLLRAILDELQAWEDQVVKAKQTMRRRHD